MRYFDTIHRVQRESPPITSQDKKSSSNQYIWFYKSLQIVLTVWIVTILGVMTNPWVSYWAKMAIKLQTDYGLQATAQIQGTSDPSVVGSQSTVDDLPQFYLKNNKIEINAPIIEGIEKENLEQGIGHHPESVWPDEKGNVVLAGSNFELDPENLYGQVFRNLRDVEIGDEVYLFFGGKTYIYKVFRKEVVSPSDTALYQPADDWLLTFYTCDPPYTDWKRLVFQAKLTRIE